MKKILAFSLVFIMLLCLMGCGNEEKIIGVWRDKYNNVKIFYEGGVGNNEGVNCTWELKGDILTIHTGDSRKHHSYIGPATGIEYEYDTGSAAYTSAYKLDTSSYPYKLISTAGWGEYVKDE